MAMKHLRYFLLLAAALLTSNTMQAQYLNFFGAEQGSVPLDKLSAMSVFGYSYTTFRILLQTDQGVSPISTIGIDSLTITDKPYFPTPSSSDKRVWIRYTDDSKEQVVELRKNWASDEYFALVYLHGETDFEYSYNQKDWAVIKDSYGYPEHAFEGWTLLTLKTSSSNYMDWLNSFAANGNRTGYARRELAAVTGPVAGSSATTIPDGWNLSMPVNDGWWASPRFKSSGEVRAGVKWNDMRSFDTEFTIHDGKIYWQDCDLSNTSWAEAKGADYSVQGKSGQKLYVNFTTGEAMVSTPDEVPFPLENPIFRTTTTMNVDYDDPRLCTVTGANGNTVQLYWNAVDGASGYRIKMGLQNDLSIGGSEVWDNPDNLLLDITVSAYSTELTIPNLNYGTNYRFAIQALSPRGEQYHSAWFGYGHPRYWYAYLALQTAARYAVPAVVSVSDVTKNSMRVNLNRSIASYDKDVQDEIRSHFYVNESGMVRVNYLTVEPSKDTPDASVAEKYARYELTAQDLEQGYVDIDGLSENSTYIIRAWDATIEAAADACYNTVTRTTKGTPGEPILLVHDDLMQQAATMTIPSYNIPRTEVYALAADYEAAPLSPTLNDFMTNSKLVEGQTFYLEGGKTYYLDGNNAVYRGFTLATRPEDVAKGLRAKVICGIGKSANVFDQATNGEQWQGAYSAFTLGRQPQEGEDGELEIEAVEFRDIDFDNPQSLNYGDYMAGAGIVSGNYFINMYSNGLGMVLDKLTFENCTFKRFVRGFIREYGANRKVWNHVLFKDNQFFDCGYYNQGAGGYAMIYDGQGNASTNLFADFQMTGNTFYDSPFPAIFSVERDLTRKGGAWNITFSNNTLVNLNTRANGAIFKMRSLPDGSVYNVQNNLFMLCKQAGDERILQMWGADIRNAQGRVTLNFSNNWSTNNDLTNGSIFSANAWLSTSNSFGKLVKDGVATLNGTLEVGVADISATDLMVSPCPPHIAQSANDQNMHRADALDGTATSEYNVNLYFKNMDNDIVKNGVGAAKWRNR